MHDRYQITRTLKNTFSEYKSENYNTNVWPRHGVNEGNFIELLNLYPLKIKILKTILNYYQKIANTHRLILKII